MSSFGIQPETKRINVNEGFLPYPATKLVISQYLKAYSGRPAYWAWIIVGAFYDKDDNCLWSTEVFAAHLDVDPDYEPFQWSSDESEAASEVVSDTESLAEVQIDAEHQPEQQASAKPSQRVPFNRASTRKRIRTASASDYHRTSYPSTRNPTTIHQHPSNSTSPQLRGTGTQVFTRLHLGTGYQPSTRGSATGSTLGSLGIETLRCLLILLVELVFLLYEFVCSVVEIMSGGWNPVNGRDAQGGRPPYAPYGAPTPAPGQPYIPPGAAPGWYDWGYGNQYPMYSSWNGITYGYSYPGWTTQQPCCQGANACTPACAYYPYSAQPNGAGNYATRTPQNWPNVDTTMPAAQMTNSSGGMGCEPGYNYFFPAEHTKVHVFHSTTPPWQLPANARIQFKATHIPCNISLAELLKGFGCDNPTAKKNKCFEIVPGGNGTWYKGLSFHGADKDMMKKTVGDLGWDATRSGHPNEKPVVCLWFAKD